MNDELNKKLVEILGQAQGASSELYGGAKQLTLQAVDLIKEQAPELVEQLLMFKLLESGFIALLCLAYLVTFVTIMWKTFWSKEIDEDAKLVILGLGGFLGGVVGFLLSFEFIHRTSEVLQILVAPKLFLLEYLIKLAGVK